MSKSKKKHQMPGNDPGSITTGSARTLIEQAKREVPGFRGHFAKFEEQVTIGGYSSSTLYNYSRAVAKVSLYFKHTVYGLRFFFRLYGLEDRVLKLPTVSNNRRLPTVFSRQELKRLFVAHGRLKQRVCYSATILNHVLNQ